jgi:N-acyl-L-homoserine lactone synthetase
MPELAVSSEPAYVDALARVDAFATDVVRRAAPVRFGVARTPPELEAVYRLRCAVVLHRGWGRPEEFPDGLERDEFDEDAIQIVAWDEDKVVGTTRLVLPANGRPLPAEKAFELEIASRGQVIDMGRTCRAPDYKDTAHAVLWGVLGRAWLETRALGFSEFCGIFTKSVIRLYRSLGLKAEILGDARPHWGELRYPVLVRPVAPVHNFTRDK